jgi:BlaI family transcriptional regulator, penicillinase repressor
VKPTQSELAILDVLWRLGPRTVRQVHDVVGGGYTTTLKLMQIMAEKGLVVRDERERAHVYTASLKKEETQGVMVRDLMDRAFGGSAAQLVMRALSEREASPEELDAIRKMLKEYER